ncbi:MAG: YkgJ family cysteine cluster protein [Desulfotignum sp.]|nr:YkgJ family cysteine cluster protein [Desulfobacteraceae bacterium]
MTEDMKPVDENDIMPFFCGPGNLCFNECCRDLNQALTPYDILRLKQNLGLFSQDFLRTYTSCHGGPQSGLPVVGFKPNPATGHACPFVTEEGCSVYPDRPASCRMYPLARAIARSRETGKIQEYFALIVEDHCKGFGENTNLTVRQWLDSQCVDLHNQYNDTLMELISLKNRMMPGTLAGFQSDQFYLALYDLDTFRIQIFDRDLLAQYNVPLSVLERIRTSDEALLELGLQWVRNQLFGLEMILEA